MKKWLILLLALCPSLALAHSTKIRDMAIGHSWALPSAEAETDVMLPLLNTGRVDDALVGATSSVAATIELRHGVDVLSQFVVVASKPFPMRGAADHIHLVGLTRPLVKGDSFKLLLKFKLAGEIELDVQVNDRAGE